ncbi:Iron-sulfur cluster assembly accessory protein [Desulfosporosinus orientis DSM 765]|uniref:Iron-sulfur cluster assembly accessory protein n=1 Tax=Desulfosporosinus orientis (strain ATCC 19365 / DSM 765 / NCIMB 8382 / VKM B-1628 / Singapore I) TaxID=768706 RepID=G7WBD8_DESOD|nr:iron-sulfur cluster assembly accessory protein [Desulfosporosinus orientis]AET68267.1 Iron-sulfur cluster assembly accessory protein [Desulfosporosinus orientis DSM 765]
MVKITEPAAQKVKEIQKAKNTENAFLRIHLLNEGCSGPNFGMTFEESITEDDMLYEEYGISIIADIGLATALEGVIIDYNESDNGNGFIMLREGIGHGGGCGGCCGNCGGSC